jgi:hypothetical protein
MRGLEMMLANLLGMKPEEMRAKVEQAIALMETGAKSMASIHSDLQLIKNHLGISQEVIDNGGRAVADSRNSANGSHIQL